MTSTLVADPLAARLVVALGGNALEDVLDVGPSLLVTTRHDRRTVAGTLLAAGNTRADESDTLAREVLGPAVGVGEVRVASVDDDVTLLQKRKKGLNPVIDSLAGLDEEHDAAGRLELGDELLVGVGTDDGLALSFVRQEVVDLGDGSVVSADGEAMVSHVHDQVLTPTHRVSHFITGHAEEPGRMEGDNSHDSQANEAEISTFKDVSMTWTGRRELVG